MNWPSDVLLHAGGVEREVLVATLAAGGLVTGFIITLALAALARRRSWSYFLVTLALATLLARTVFGILSVNGMVGTGSHHLFEHGLDVLTVLLLLGAVYSARTVERREVDAHE